MVINNRLDALFADTLAQAGGDFRLVAQFPQPGHSGTKCAVAGRFDNQPMELLVRRFEIFNALIFLPQAGRRATSPARPIVGR